MIRRRLWAGGHALSAISSRGSAEPGGFPGRANGFSIGIVCFWTEQLLTKRRAVDFCRVATALCPRG